MKNIAMGAGFSHNKVYKKSSKNTKQILFNQLLKENEGILSKVVNQFIASEYDRKDFKQEIIYQLWKSYDSFSGRSKFSTWMYRVSLNTALKYLKKKKKIISSIGIDENLLQKIDVKHTRLRNKQN
ncbi:sigma-70 family RNA polymerase sigma factor [Flavobacteriaceae bacterium 3-367]|uniref:sigma-70 family RNA polymerase sigma factor n=1 Tax=Eudoraea algarum TaxID=3417568 RepID=UPI0032802A42